MKCFTFFAFRILDFGFFENCALTGSNLKKCSSDKCTVKFCEECFSQRNGSSSVCMSPAEYGDMSNLSEDLYSSIDESDANNIVKITDGSNQLICVDILEMNQLICFRTLEMNE